MAKPKQPAQAFRAYRKRVSALVATGKATEHSFRSSLEELIRVLGDHEIEVINEPTQIAVGAPDLEITRSDVPIGYIECKEVNAALERVAVSDQLTRYREGLPNLILTNYREFRWYVKGELRDIADSSKGTEVLDLFESFVHANVPTVTSANTLAKLLAVKARLLRKNILRVLADEPADGILTMFLAHYREFLITNLPEGAFADLKAQTAAYGMFASRCLWRSNGAFTKYQAIDKAPTPFLKNVLTKIVSATASPKITWIIDDLADLLNRTDIEQVVADFGQRSRGEDPVVHFYEDFLAAYDRRLKVERGVFYTPKPVVQYIVRSIDTILRDKFGLSEGMATQQEDGQELAILDPAAGTGTFLIETIKRIRDTVTERGWGGFWPEYVKQQLVPRLYGFEILMAPYVICHLNVALSLTQDRDEIDTHRSPAQLPNLNILLTNTLEPAQERTTGPLWVGSEMAKESRRADEVKTDKPVMVVMGNPPYAGHSANNGEWINNLMRGVGSPNRKGSYFHVAGTKLQERNPKWVNDDYVKFIRFAQWRIERTGRGVTGYVTNHTFLDNPTFRAMRYALLESFDEIYILDLHGNTRREVQPPNGLKDDNVFDIQQGVCVSFFVKYAEPRNPIAKVFRADLWGTRDQKNAWLAQNGIESTDWKEVSLQEPYYFFAHVNDKHRLEYKAGWRLTDIFLVKSAGIVTARDRVTIQWTEDDIKKTVREFASVGAEEARNAWRLQPDSKAWQVALAQADIRKHQSHQRHFIPIQYRAFDRRYTYYTGQARGFLCRPRHKVMRHMIAGENLGLVSCRQRTSTEGLWNLCAVTRDVIEGCFISNSTREINSLFPLYLYENATPRIPNLNRAFVDLASDRLGLEFIEDGAGDLESTFGPEDILSYIYALLNSQEYCRRFTPYLRYNFPRVPVTKSVALFRDLVAVGQRYVSLHLMEFDALEAFRERMPAYPTPGTNTIEKVRYENGRVWINGAQYFEGVDPETWDGRLGKYKPAQKWLKDRQGRALTMGDIQHYQRICATLAESHELVRSIDDTIESHGGWPLQ